MQDKSSYRLCLPLWHRSRLSDVLYASRGRLLEARYHERAQVRGSHARVTPRPHNVTAPRLIMTDPAWITPYRRRMRSVPRCLHSSSLELTSYKAAKFGTHG